MLGVGIQSRRWFNQRLCGVCGGVSGRYAEGYITRRARLVVTPFDPQPNGCGFDSQCLQSTLQASAPLWIKTSAK